MIVVCSLVWLGSASQPATQPVCADWRGVWRAEAQGLDPSLREFYEELVQRFGVRMRPEDEPAYRQSLRRFLAQRQRGLKDPLRAQGIIGGLAWCTYKACGRGPLDQSSLEQVRAWYDGVFDQMWAEARRQLLSAAPGELSDSERALIERRIEEARSRLRLQVRELQGDFLFPAFKSTPGPEREQSLLKQLVAAPGRYTFPDDDLGPLLWSRRERFLAWANDVATNLAQRAMFDAMVDVLTYESWDADHIVSSISASQGFGFWPMDLYVRPWRTATTRRVCR